MANVAGPWVSTLLNTTYHVSHELYRSLTLDQWSSVRERPALAILVTVVFLLGPVFLLAWKQVRPLLLGRKAFGEEFLESQLQKERKELERHVFAAPMTDAIWEIGTTWRSCSVVEEGVLRAFEFTGRRGQVQLDVEHVVATLLKAMVEPIQGPGEPVVRCRPRVATFLHSTPLPLPMIHQVAASMLRFGVKVFARAEVEKDLPALEAKRKVELMSGAKRTAPKTVTMLSPPPRGCFVCKKEITGKPSQCSACKAVIYCGAACAKKDWPGHKGMCPTFKEHMSHFATWRIHSFPFPYYPEEAPLCNYNAINFLMSQGVHNVGVFRRMCQCFARQPWGSLWTMDQRALASAELGESEQAEFSGLGAEWYPLSRAADRGIEWKGGVRSERITDWATYYAAKGVPLSDPAALILHMPLTIWGAYRTFLKDKLASPTGDGRKSLTIHVAGAEKEADILSLFQVLMPFFPGTDLTIHLVGDQLATEAVQPFVVEDAELDTTLCVTVTPALYGATHLSGEAFQQAPHGTGKPDFVILLNANLLQHPTWPATVQLLAQSGTSTVITEPMEQAAEAVMRQLKASGLPVTDVRLNPFRMPLFQFTKDVNLPAFENGFWYAFHC